MAKTPPRVPKGSARRAALHLKEAKRKKKKRLDEIMGKKK